MWKTNTTYVDLETGEKLEEKKVREEYIIKSKKTKHTYNATTDKGTREITYECEQSKQRRLF